MNPKDTFISAYQKYIHRTGSDSLLDRLLATDFFEAPASTKFHNSFAGGLVLHSLNVFQRMCRNCMNELGTDTLFPPKQVESVAIVSLLHDSPIRWSSKTRRSTPIMARSLINAVLTTWNLCHSTR